MRRQRELLGFKVIMGGGYGGTHRASNYSMLTSGCLPFYSNVAPSAPLETEKSPLKTRQKVLDMVEKQLPELRQFGGLAIFFQDERHGMADSKTPTAEALAEFRKFLKPRYAGIAELNRAWGRKYKSFEEVMPVLTADYDANKETSIAPWLEWRLWALEEVLTTDRLGAAKIRKAVGVPCNLGLEGIFGLAMHNIPYGGTDLDRQSDFFNIIGPYGEKLTNAARSFYPDGFLFSWSGYNRTHSQYQRYIWNCAFEGHGGIGWWYGPIYYNSTDCLYPQARWVRDLSRPIREGIGKLLMENRPSRNDSIAFLYSQSSLYAMCGLGKHVDPEHSHLLSGRPRGRGGACSRCFTMPARSSDTSPNVRFRKLKARESNCWCLRRRCLSIRRRAKLYANSSPAAVSCLPIFVPEYGMTTARIRARGSSTICSG
jgi:hypothetical protein